MSCFQVTGDNVRSLVLCDFTGDGKNEVSPDCLAAYVTVKSLGLRPGGFEALFITFIFKFSGQHLNAAHLFIQCLFKQVFLFRLDHANIIKCMVLDSTYGSIRFFLTLDIDTYSNFQ